MNNNEIVLQAQGLHKRYTEGRLDVSVLRGRSARMRWAISRR